MSKIVIIKKDGLPTTPMAQAQAETYLGKLINKDRVANLKQSLNDVTGGKGKPTGAYKFYYPATNPVTYSVLHASSGNGEKSVSLFFYKNTDGDQYIFAMGEHKTSTSYKLVDYGQPADGLNATFKEGATISLS